MDEEQQITPNRLINVHTLQLKEFMWYTPTYAILSHRWSKQETSYHTYEEDKLKRTPGTEKIKQFCRLVQSLESIDWVWVDTCCIDKRSSAELSEAINSMADWYRNAEYCVAYLDDVPEGTDWVLTFRDSMWFTRGWTLQELLFPRTVIFCNQAWTVFMGLNRPNHASGTALISEITGIPQACFGHPRAVKRQCIAKRLSWAAKRITTRLEDEAYCLLGLLEINMPLLYGEGRRAFTRLQEEIIRQHDDESIFAWCSAPVPPTGYASDRLLDVAVPLLAASPASFRYCQDMISVSIVHREPYALSNKGLNFAASLICFDKADATAWIIQLNCCWQSDGEWTPFLLALAPSIHNVYVRIHPYSDLWTRHAKSNHGMDSGIQRFTILATNQQLNRAHYSLDAQDPRLVHRLDGLRLPGM